MAENAGSAGPDPSDATEKQLPHNNDSTPSGVRAGAHSVRLRQCEPIGGLARVRGVYLATSPGTARDRLERLGRRWVAQQHRPRLRPHRTVYAALLDQAMTGPPAAAQRNVYGLLPGELAAEVERLRGSGWLDVEVWAVLGDVALDVLGAEVAA